MFRITEPAYVYAVMPVIAAAVGYATKLLVIEMIFAPLEFKGIGPIGWQGIIPRRAAKMASITVETLTAELLNPRELFDLIDTEALIRTAEPQLWTAVDEIAYEIAEDLRPGVWRALPAAARERLLSQAHRVARGAIRGLSDEVRENLEQVLDLEHLVVTRLVTDKVLLTRVFRAVAGKEIRFMATAGGISGALIGCIQVAAFIATGSHLVLPAFGLLTGGYTDWLALHMVFRPVKPGRMFGVFKWQGVFHARREAITQNYAAVVSKELITPAVVVEALLLGPSSDRLYAIIEAQIEQVIEEQGGVVTPFAKMVVGSTRFEQLKRRTAALVIARLPNELARAQNAAEEAALDEFIVGRMALMTDEQYEELLRPVFRDDEKTVIIVGALLGFIVGELQALLLL